MAHDYLDPGRGVLFTATIKDKDYMPYKVQIVSSVVAPYPIFTVHIHVPQNDMILDKVYGQEKCVLDMQSRTPSETEAFESLKFELFVTNISFPMDSKAQLSQDEQIDMTPVKLTMVPIESFKTITTFVNEIYENQTVKQIIEDLASKTGATLEYGAAEQNSEVIYQAVVPPMTLYKALGYLDWMFGIFDGTPAYYCTYDNKFFVSNLSDNITKTQDFTITQLASKMEDDKDIIKKTIETDHFYTTGTVDTTWKSNSAISVWGKQIKSIVKPRYTLYEKFEQDIISDIANSNALVDGGDIPISDSLDNRIVYYTQHTGYESTTTFVGSYIAKRLSSLSTIVVPIEMSIPAEVLMKVGSCVFFDPRVSEYQDISGKYILKTSILDYNYEKEFQAVAKLHLMRTNKIKK